VGARRGRSLGRRSRRLGASLPMVTIAPCASG
jgi:hypothetical protein